MDLEAEKGTEKQVSGTKKKLGEHTFGIFDKAGIKTRQTEYEKMYE